MFGWLKLQYTGNWTAQKRIGSKTTDRGLPSADKGCSDRRDGGDQGAEE